MDELINLLQIVKDNFGTTLEIDFELYIYNLFITIKNGIVFWS